MTSWRKVVAEELEQRRASRLIVLFVVDGLIVLGNRPRFTGVSYAKRRDALAYADYRTRLIRLSDEISFLYSINVAPLNPLP
jgi:hypothetical protein